MTTTMNRRLPFLAIMIFVVFGNAFDNVGWAEDSITNSRTSASLLDDLDWHFIGPWRGGRVNAVSGHPTEKRTFIAGYTGGGIWKTESGGADWKNVSDGQIGVGSIGAIDISNSHPDIIYAGTGEQALRGDVSHGDGVYKSTDGGKTWTNVGLEETRQIAKLIIHPTDPNIVYVAALGHFAGPNEERGVFRTSDGGVSWKQVLYVDDNTGAVGLTLDESNPDRLIAGMWDVRRFPWGIRSAGPASGIYRSTNGGDTWEDISANEGLPQGIKERMDVSISQNRPDRIWVLMSAAEGRGLYRSDDFGDTWENVNNDAQLTGRTYYFQKLHADPVDPEIVYVMNWNILVSKDGGESFEIIPSGHADHHAFWIDPEDNQRMIDGSDGGAQVSFNGGANWSTLQNQPTAQFYTLTVDDQEPYNLYGSQQDWGSMIVSSLARDVDPRGYFDIGYSEGGHIAISRDNPNVLYIGDHHWLLRYDRRTDSVKYIGPRDETNYGVGTRDIKYRFNWTFPVVASMHDERTLYIGSQYLHRSSDGGETWDILGPDLTRADPDKLELTPGPGRDTSANDRYWGPLTRDSNGDHWFSTLYTIAESPLSRKIIWTGSDDGRVHVSKNGGRTWENVTPTDVPDYALVTRIDASAHDADTAYVTASAYKLDDYRPFIFKTNDGGKTWKQITNGIAPYEIMRVVREDKDRKGILYAGAESGFYISLNDGDKWIRPDSNLPVVPIHELRIKNDSLVVATHGRGFWSFNHRSLIQQLAAVGEANSPTLFEPAPAVRRDGDWAERNPPQGAVIQYWLPEEAATLSLEIVDGEGASVAVFEANSEDDALLQKTAGMHSFVWDLRYPNATIVPGVVTRGKTNVAPIAVPGLFAVRLTMNGDAQEKTLRLLPGPNVSARQHELQGQFDFLVQVRDKIDELNKAVIELRGFANSIEAFEEAPDAAIEILRELRLIEQRLVQPKAQYSKDLHAHPVQLNDKLYRLANFTAASHSKPTSVQYGLRDEFFDLTDAVLREYYALKNNDIRSYNESAEEYLRIEQVEALTTSPSTEGGATMPRR